MNISNSEKMKAWRRKNPEKGREYQAAWRKRNAEKHRADVANRDSRERKRARYAVWYALHTGKLTKGPCEMGNDECFGLIQAHHDDYEKPLDVRWLCSRHHGMLHAST